MSWLDKLVFGVEQKRVAPRFNGFFPHERDVLRVVLLDAVQKDNDLLLTHERVVAEQLLKEARGRG